MLPILIFLIAVFLLVLSYLSPKTFSRIIPWTWSAGKNDIPGPSRLPFIGNGHQVGKVLHESLYGLALKYGPFFKLDLFGQGAVVVSDAKLVKELLSETPASGRPDFRHVFDVHGLQEMKHGIISGDGDHLEELRRFAVRHLKDFGFGRKTMEESIMVEVVEFINRIKANGQKPVSDLKERLIIAVVNTFWGLVAGQRSSHDDEGTKNFILAVDDAFGYLQNECSALTMMSPWFAQTFPKLSGYAEYSRRFHKLAENYFLKTVEDHRKTVEPDFDRDFVDVFLKEIEKNSDNPNSAFHKTVGLDHLQQVLFDLYVAGNDTTSTTLSFAVLYLSKYPETQAKLRHEIFATTGSSRPCCLADRTRMPYTEAVLAETMRLSSIVPQAVMHRSMKDMEFKGYTIPNDTLIIPNLYFIHHDPKVWADPWEFRPERFLSADGKSFKKHEALIPFSAGRRQCLGESLARDSLFLFLSNTFQNFEVEFDKNGPENDLKPTIGVTLTPKPFNVIFKDGI